MKKKNLPETSKEAHARVTPEMLSAHHSKIIKALERLGTATYEEMANYTGMDRHAIGRRLSELERMEIVYKPGEKRLTKSGRNAYLYTLKIAGQIVTRNIEKTLPGKTISDYSKKIIQPKLF